MYYYEDQTQWEELVVKTMRMDYSWDVPSKEYVDLYLRTIAVDKK